jgi:hypothetical protein
LAAKIPYFTTITPAMYKQAVMPRKLVQLSAPMFFNMRKGRINNTDTAGTINGRLMYHCLAKLSSVNVPLPVLTFRLNAEATGEQNGIKKLWNEE